MELIIAIWGGVISTVLAIIQIWEFWKDRFKINISFGINCPDYKQNQIIITNLSKRPITIQSFDLYWLKNLDGVTSTKNLETGFEQDCCITIPPHHPRRFTFKEEYYFSVHPNRGNLYLSLSITGRRKAFVKKLFPF